MSNIQIESDLKDILNKLDSKLDYIDHKFEQKLDNLQKDTNNKLDNLQKEVTDINLRLTKVETKLDSEFSTFKEDIKEIKGSQKAQIWALIGILITAVGGFIVAVGKVVFFTP